MKPDRWMYLSLAGVAVSIAMAILYHVRIGTEAETATDSAIFAVWCAFAGVNAITLTIQITWRHRQVSNSTNRMTEDE